MRPQAEEPLPRLLVDQLRTCSRELAEGRAHVGDLVRDMVHPRPALLEEPANRRVVAEGGEELDAPGPHHHGSGLDALVLHPVPVLELTAEEPCVRRDRLIEVMHGDAEVMDAAAP